MSNPKIINTSHGYIYKYDTLRRKLHKCNANTYFNQKCLIKHLNPNYAAAKCRHEACRQTARRLVTTIFLFAQYLVLSDTCYMFRLFFHKAVTWHVLKNIKETRTFWAKKKYWLPKYSCDRLSVCPVIHCNGMSHSP